MIFLTPSSVSLDGSPVFLAKDFSISSTVGSGINSYVALVEKTITVTCPFSSYQLPVTLWVLVSRP